MPSFPAYMNQLDFYEMTFFFLLIFFNTDRYSFEAFQRIWSSWNFWNLKPLRVQPFLQGKIYFFKQITVLHLCLHGFSASYLNIFISGVVFFFLNKAVVKLWCTTEWNFYPSNGKYLSILQIPCTGKYPSIHFTDIWCPLWRQLNRFLWSRH